jgi:hypothetical protein
MDWTYIQNSLPSWRLWLDVHTAVILKDARLWQRRRQHRLQDEYIVNTVQYDPPNLPDALFSVTPFLRAGFQRREWCSAGCPPRPGLPSLPGTDPVGRRVLLPSDARG